MKISHSFYELITKHPIQSKKTHTVRKGALLQVEFDDETVGYADCHPWEEFGDLPLPVQLDLLKDGKCTRLTARSLYFAKADAKARQSKSNLLSSHKIPMSHYLISQLEGAYLDDVKDAWEKGFTHFKIKLGNDLEQEERLLTEMMECWPKIKMRLDFNAKLNPQQLVAFLEKMNRFRKSIDYIEDPFPFNYSAWRKIQEGFQISLAADEYYREAYGHPEAAQVLIMKPAVHTLKPVDTLQRLIITSYLDHPLGQVCAAYMASLACDEPCGLLSHHIYQPNSYSEMLMQKGPFLQATPGYGLGFDELLKKEKFR